MRQTVPSLVIVRVLTAMLVDTRVSVQRETVSSGGRLCLRSEGERD